MELGVGIVIGAMVASAAWWSHVRSLNGVISDLKDIGSDAKAAQAKAAMVAGQGISAVKGTISSSS